MNQYQEYIHLSRYSRWIDEISRRETWDETVDRYVSFFVKRFGDVFPKKEIRDSIYNLKIVPSMRALMTAGKALDRDNVAGYNCLAGETLVTTKEYGIIEISKLVGKRVHIVDGNGHWVESECKSYGKQHLMKINFGTSGKGQFSIFATSNHRWIKKNGDVVFTDNLKEGDRLCTVSMPEFDIIDENSNDYKLGIQHGIIYGDGTAQYKRSLGRSEKTTQVEKHCSGFVIRLCKKSNELLKYFDGYPSSQPKSFRGDNVVYVYDRAMDLKSLPDTTVFNFSSNYLKGFLRGWMAADGTGSATLATNAAGKEWLYTNAHKVGFVIINDYPYPNETNLGVRKETLYSVAFDRRYLTPDDFLFDDFKSKFKQIDINKNPGFGKIKSVEATDRYEEVYCFEVQTTKSFLLTKNLLTGNCSFLAIDHPRAFDECMYVLMCGSGVGFSVERQHVSKLPQIPEELYPTETTIVVADSKIGWASAFKELIQLLYAGHIPKWDVSKVRPAGARLKTFGGRASGPQPLVDLFKFTVNVFKNGVGRKLNSIECHDIVCKIADIVVSGGVRRSALISLSNLSDDRMRHAKQGQFWIENSQRSLANNSAAYTEKPEIEIFMKEWLALIESKSGERGIVNREAIQRKMKRLGKRDFNFDFGMNPCAEIFLRPCGFCNLSEIIIRQDDTLESLMEKVRHATIVGTFQSTLTNFRYLRPIWKKNAEEERLLGVSMTGIMDHPVLSRASDEAEMWLTKLKEVAEATNAEYAEKLGINQSVAITCVKPSGCFEKSQKIKTDRGILSLDDIFKINGIDLEEKTKDYREWYDVKETIVVYDENNEEQTITKLFVNGVEETIKFTFEDGMEVECTPNHKFKLSNGEWKMAKDLTEDDDIMQW